jgi:hypothetical protein
MIKCSNINVFCPHAMSIILQNNKGQSTEFTICDIGINNCILNKINYIYMEDYVARMIQEHAQLVTRIDKLHNFIYNECGYPRPFNPSKVTVVDYANMCIQLKAMKVYRDALGARLENAGIWYDGTTYREEVATVQEVLKNPIPDNDKPTDEE